ncbi:pentalenolactone synthase [Mycolicibacterium sp. BK556]|uniref:cytochrome P450 n=1 Tax=unclassified Mycolicibacterium TaxID=2636767 RepID=UPI001620B025|nr:MULTISPECIES: cytochrome P450 [unclassified Mycolicibacterium]MBB3604471.1 pentalenolactone synthase [Mycolicibacterium sp. BK556]MBB3634816.1 pentalenolactone synthase [Mycolicibacterium sp. BK607]
MTATAQLPFRQSHPLRSPDQLRALQGTGPIHKILTAVGDEAWLVTGYTLVRRLMDDERLGRTHRDPANAPRSRTSALFGGPIGDFDSEPTDHARMRRLLLPHFGPRHMRTLHPKVEGLCTTLLDDMERHGSPADLLTGLAQPLPILVICDLLGVPYADRDRFRLWVDDAAFSPDDDVSLKGLESLLGYGMELVTAKRAHPDDDVISRLCDEPDLSDFEIATLAMQLLFAGHETTVTQIWVGSLLLLTNPDQWQALLADADLIPKAVEEILRAGMVGGVGVPRYARADIDADGVTIREGDLVLLDPGAANHDPEFFADPDQLDLARTGTAHVGFGYGLHYCVGAALARLELKTVYSQLIPRFPTMRLCADPSTMTAGFHSLSHGLVALPVTW